MSRITSYSAVSSTAGLTGLADDDVFIIDGTNGSRKITAKELANAIIDKYVKNGAATPYTKSGIYRGANLGSGATFANASTAAQRTAISSGTFEGLFIGDYWTVGGRIYRIADFNYWKGSGDTVFNTNHIVLVPDLSFGNDVMNDTNTTTGAYIGSKMYADSSSVLNTARTTLLSDFGGYLASHREYLANAVTDGAQSAGAWYDSVADIMNEPMVYGCFVKSKIYSGIQLATADKSQLALFRLNPVMINTRYNYWLRDVISSESFSFVHYIGTANAFNASNSAGVRPAFAVKGTI